MVTAPRLPAWLGWSAVILGVVALAPEPIGDVGLVGLGLWIVTTAAVLRPAHPE